MKAKKSIGIAIVACLIFSGVAAVAVEAEGYSNKEKQETPFEDNMFELFDRIINRIRDTLGICNGGCNETVEISGILSYDGTYFFVDEIEVHFGPVWYISKTQSNVDYDEDGEFELIIDELYGLVGTNVILEGYMQSDNWFSVFIINGEIYRDLGKPIWSGGAGGHHGGK